MSHTIDEVVMALDKAYRLIGGLKNVLDVEGREECAASCESAIGLCNSIGDSARKYSSELRKEPRTEREMVNLITRDLEDKAVKVKSAKGIPGGMKSAALRRADGKCELCGHEWGLSTHHIIPRAGGGLDEPENLIVLCKTCHDDVEGREFVSREDVFRYGRLRVRAEDALSENTKSEAAKKANITKAANAVKRREEDAEVSEWADQWSMYRSWSMHYREDPEIERPEKLWHVAVYGGGREMYESLRKQRKSPTA